MYATNSSVQRTRHATFLICRRSAHSPLLNPEHGISSGLCTAKLAGTRERPSTKMRGPAVCRKLLTLPAASCGECAYSR